MPPLLGSRALRHAGQLVSGSKQSVLFQVVFVVLIIAVITWTVNVFILQRKSRSPDINVNALEKPVPKCTLARHDSGMCQTGPKADHNNYLSSLQAEILSQTEKPIYPWISPPQPLPGPYDPMYYPLPAPSPRHSMVTSDPAGVEGRHSTSYTRLVPNARTPFNEAVLYGTTTTSTKGWRRSHWNVTGG